MQAFHNDPAIKAALVAQLEAHYAADEIIKGTYWEGGKGCAVGCCVHSGDHSLFESRYRIPEKIAALMDGIFEGLPNDSAKAFPLAVIKAIPVGADLSRVINHFLEWLLIDPEHGVARFNAAPSILAVAALHRRIIDGGAVQTEEWAAARDAARAEAAARDADWAAARAAARAEAADWAAAMAADAARAAAMDADWAAAWAAAMAADAARAAAMDADWAADWDAARKAQAQKLVELLAAA
jgi:hypothetical protein